MRDSLNHHHLYLEDQANQAIAVAAEPIPAIGVVIGEM
jgi:hypothetical protein